MKHTPIIFLFLCLCFFIGVQIIEYPMFPERVASHFNAAGIANGWMSKPAYLTSMVGIGLGLPVFVIGIILLMRVLPASTLNVPYAEYWRSPENYPRACRFMLQSSFWYGGVLLLWNAFLSHTILLANQKTPPDLDQGSFIVISVAFLMITGLWIVYLYWWFGRNRADQ